MDEGCQIIVGADVTSAANDKQQVTPLIKETLDNLEAAGIETPKQENGTDVEIPLLADTGYFSEDNVAELEEAGFDPHIATGRQKHNQPQPPEDSESSDESQSDEPPKLTPKETMSAKLRTSSGRERYANESTLLSRCSVR